MSGDRATNLRPILMLTSGGLEDGGGIGRLIGYMIKAWPDAEAPIKVLDTRGRGPVYAWPFFLISSLIQVLLYKPRQPLLHVHLASGGSTLRKFIVIGFGRLLNLDMIIHLHDPDYGVFYQKLPPWARAKVRWMFHCVKRVVVLGKAAENAIADVLEVPRDRIVIVPNAVSSPTEVPARQRVGKVNILFLGYLSHRKGVHDLIEAFARPQLGTLEWTATLAGGGVHQPGYEQQTAALGLNGRVTFPGWVDQEGSRALLTAADILVLPSYGEGMPMSVLEGMAYGLCIVCTHVGALSEVVVDGVSARIVAPGDVDGLATALAECVGDAALRQRLGQGAREAYLRDFNIADYPGRIIEVYRQVRAEEAGSMASRTMAPR